MLMSADMFAPDGAFPKEVKEADVGVGPGTWFGINCDGFLRVMFACYADDAVILEACERMKAALSKLA